MRDTAPHAPIAPPAPLASRVLRDVAALLWLAWPVMLSRAGMLVMAFTTIALLGRYGPGAAGEANLGLAIFVPLLVVAIGLCSGVVPVVSRAYGAGDHGECGRAWARALRWGGLVGLGGAGLCWFGETWLGLFGQTAEMAARGGAVARALAPGLLGQVLFAVSAFALEATRAPKPALVVMVGANLANLALNWLLIWGQWGLPELGAVGAAWGGTLARLGMGAALIGYIAWVRPGWLVGLTRGVWGPGGWAAGAMMRRMGVAAGLSNGFETVGFASMTLVAGTLGPLALDAYAMSHNLLSTLFMVGLGLAVATGVRVGNALGAGRPDEARFVGWVGLGTALGVMTILGAAVYLGRDGVAAVYTDDPMIAARAAGLFVLAACVFVPDSAQVVMGQALRAYGDAWVPVAIYVAVFIGFLIPGGWLAVHGLGFDERALVATIILSCWAATLLLAWRFHRLTRRGRA